MPRSSSWREMSRKHIKQVGDALLENNPDVDLKWLKAEISKAYPFGPRENHPYQMWLSELRGYINRVQFGRTGWVTDAPFPAVKKLGVNKDKRKGVPAVEGQLNLFEEEK